MGLRDDALAAYASEREASEQRAREAVVTRTDADILSDVEACGLADWFPQASWQVRREDDRVFVFEDTDDVLFAIQQLEDDSWHIDIYEPVTNLPEGWPAQFTHFATVLGPETVGAYLADRDLRRGAASA